MIANGPSGAYSGLVKAVTQPDLHLRRLYEHIEECIGCQIRSGQDGRLCPEGNRLRGQRDVADPSDPSGATGRWCFA